MCGINESLEFIGGTKSTAGRKERANVIAKTAIVRMLSYGHYLYAVIAIGYYARQHIETKLVVGANFFCILSHAYVALIDEERTTLRTEFGIFHS